MARPLLPVFETINGESRMLEHDALKQTDAEIAAGVTPVNYAYDPGEVDRYGRNETPGTTDMTAAWNAAAKVCKTSGHDLTYGRTWPYLVTAPIDMTCDALQDFYGFSVVCKGQVQAVTDSAPGYPSILANHTGHVFDCAGAPAINWYDVSVGTVSGGSVPKTCWFLARNSAGSSQIHRFNSCRVRGSFSEAVLYNYGSEDGTYTNCQFYNTNTGGNAHWGVFTANNIRGLASTFITIATGNQSTINHLIVGGSFALLTDNSAGKGLYLDNIRLMKIIGPHLICGHMGVSAHSHIFIDTTNGGSDLLTLVGVSGEQDAPAAKYGIYVGDTTVTTGSWSIMGCSFPNSIAMLQGHANVHIDGLVISNLGNQSAGGGVVISGTLSGGYVDNVSGGFSPGALGENGISSVSQVISTSGDAYLRLRDLNAASNAKNSQWRANGNHVTLELLDDTLGGTATVVDVTRSGTTISRIGLNAVAYDLSNGLPGSYANDAAAAGAGISIGQLYRNGSVVMIRVT